MCEHTCVYLVEISFTHSETFCDLIGECSPFTFIVVLMCLDYSPAFCFIGQISFISIFSLSLSFFLIWNASQICVSSLCWGHANPCIIPILVYVLLKQALISIFESYKYYFYFSRVLNF